MRGKVALVTGGTRGIGRAISERFLKAGAKVVVVSRHEVDLSDIAPEHSENLFHEVFDVALPERAGELVGRILNEHDRIDILVNNAGIHLKKAAEETSAEEMESVLRTHIVGAHALAASVYPDMARRGSGSILFVASMASFLGLPQVIAYSAAKTGVLGLVRTLAAEWSPQGVRVNAIAPGWIETEMLKKALEKDSDRRERILQRTPLQRFGLPEEVAAAALYLCSDESSFVTGAVLPVDGGASIGF